MPGAADEALQVEPPVAERGLGLGSGGGPAGPQGIAETLSLAEDSVKKYVSRILSVTGCQSRMELALLARSQT